MVRRGVIPSRILLATVAISSLAAPHSRPARASSMTVLVPAYVYPAGAGRAVWDQLAAAARSITVEAVLNPGSGPGPARDPHYAAVVDQLRNAGGRVLGYVHTSYGKRPRAAVEQDILTYLKFYNIDGFFIDEMANTAEMVGYYEAIYQSLKQWNPAFRVVGNPGTAYTLPAYLNAADTLVIFEGPAAAYADYRPLGPAPWVAHYPPSRFANIVYAVADAAGMQQALTEARRSHAGSVFITDNQPPNPYRGLPSYWTQEVAAIEALDVPQPSATASTSGDAPAAPAAVAIGSTPPAPAMVPTAPPAPTMVLPPPVPAAFWIPQCACEPRLFRRLFQCCRPARR